MSSAPASRNSLTWWICGLLLCASLINYMDRMTLSTVSKRITTEFQLLDEQYGWIETAFGLAFASGALIFGFIADRTNVRWLYPIVLFLWSLMGFLTGFVETFTGLLLCRMFLGLFESGHWPCALKTTHRLLPPESRALGNSILQSGAAIGAIITPLIMRAMLTDAPGSWRPAFQIIGAAGVIWVFVWIFLTNSTQLAPFPVRVRSTDEINSATPSADDDDTFLKAVFSRKFLVLVIIVVAINACWQLLRVWLPKFLQTGRGYEEQTMLWIMFFYYVATDVGCLSAGLLTKQFHRTGFSVHSSRSVVFGICATMVAAGVLIPWLPAGPALITVMMLMAMGSLGLFPCYYSFSQELSSRHQGVVTGLLGTLAWLTSSPLHPILGRWADQTKSYDLGLAMSCGLPLLAFFSLAIFWPGKPSVNDYNGTAVPE